MGGHACSPKCPNLKIPIISKVYPLTRSVAGLSPMGEIRGVTEEFVPHAFHFLICKDVEIKIILKDLNLLDIEIDFKLVGEPQILPFIYTGDWWKASHLEDLLKERQLKVDYNMGPIFVSFLNRWLRVIKDSVKLWIDSEEKDILVNDTAELVGLPNCYPPLTDDGKLRHKGYSYHFGKASVFYAPIVLNKEYKLSFQVEAVNFFYETGFLFPFKFVDVEKIRIESGCEFGVANRLLRLVNPHTRDIFPPRQEYEWGTRSDVSGNYPPWIVKADPFRDQPLTGNFQPQQELPVDGFGAVNIDTYGILETVFMLGVPKDKEFISRVSVTEDPLPVRIYDQLQKLPNYRNFLISYDLINLNEKPLELEITSEILGITDPAVTTITIPGYKSDKSSRDLITQCPLLKFDTLSKITSATRATLKYKIAKKTGSGEVVLENNTREIKLLPHDVIVWNLSDQKGGTEYDLSPLIGAWISATDPNGALDEVRGKSAKYHPLGALVGNQGGEMHLEDITSQVKALYDCLNKEYGIKYVNQAFSYGFNTGGQRVVLPERVIQSKAGNCIDLVVLFSSLMDGLGLNPLLLLTSTHAFLGWGNKYSTNEMGFLECTLLGGIDPSTKDYVSFEKASEAAKKTFKDEFLFSGSDDYLPIHSITFGSTKGLIIDLSEVRKQGISRF